jgi:hypothetical protein
VRLFRTITDAAIVGVCITWGMFTGLGLYSWVIMACMNIIWLAAALLVCVPRAMMIASEVEDIVLVFCWIFTLCYGALLGYRKCAVR